MLASFIIRYYTRRIDNLLQTLRFLELWHSDVISQSEVLLLCQNRCGKIPSGFKQTRNFNMDLPEMSMAPQLNFGVDHAESDLIVLLDSDRILPVGYYRAVFDTIQEKQMVSTLKMNRLTTMTPDRNIINDDYDCYEEWRSTKNDPLTRNIFSGNVTFWKKDFYEAGKADEGYVGYGWEDHDMTQRMESIGVKSIFRKEIELHLHHEPMTYGKQDQKKLFIQNGVRYCRKWRIPYPDTLKEDIQRNMKAII